MSRLWDALYTEGSIALVRATLALVHLHVPVITPIADDLAEAMMLLGDAPSVRAAVRRAAMGLTPRRSRLTESRP